MATLYEQLGQSMSSAVEYGAKGNRFWQLDLIDKKYDVKRKRLEKLVNLLGYGVEAAQKVNSIYNKNRKLEDIGKARGYEVDTGFLGLGNPKFYNTSDRGQESSLAEVVLGKDYPEFNEFAEIFNLYSSKEGK